MKSATPVLLIVLLLAILGVELALYHTKRARQVSEQLSLTPIELRLDGLPFEDEEAPIAVDFQNPTFGWMLPPAQGRQQAAYEILVASSRGSLDQNNGDLWDSGKVNSGESVQIDYGGKPLVSGGWYFWKVRVWDAAGTMSIWSSPAYWTMGLLKASDWKAKWIGLDEGDATNSRTLPARWLRKEFVLSKPFVRETVYFSGLGWSELYVNGQKVGDHVLSPPLSQYPKREYYETCELAGLLNSGSNALGVVLGDGRFYAPRTNAANAGYPKLFLQLHVEFSDGTATNIVSDDSWKLTTNGPITANNEYDGEEYDARKEFPGWSRPGFDDSSWQRAELVSAPGGVFSAMRQAPIRVTQEIKPVSMKEIKPGIFIFDLGQNIAGWCKLNVEGPAGTQVTLRHAETLTNDELYTDNLRKAKVTDVYTLKGGGPETWQPRFTLHGFRYVEMKGYPGKPTLDSLTGCVVGDDLPVSGDFECSNPLINKIYHNIVWGVRDNYRSIPTDCPQRDERQGWLGDRAEESRGETYFFDNDALYSKWMQDIADCQRTNGNISSVCPTYWRVYADEVTWASASVVIPAMLRDEFGDKRVIAEHYDSAKKWIDYMRGFITNGIVSKDVYGDWCMPPEDPKLIHSRDPSRITGRTLLATPFFYNDLRLMQGYAMQLGKTDDAEHYGKLAETMKDAFNKQFFNRDTGQYDNGTPTSSVLPLAFDMVAPELRYRAFQFLVNKLAGTWNNHIGTGLVGGKYLLRVLSENGRPDLAYTIVTQTNYPGWGYMVEHDATTVWELWNGDTADPSMNSGNHVMLIGDLAIWMYEQLAGIKADPDYPGFKHIIMRPLPIGDLTFVKASHRSAYGWIQSEWHREGNEFDWHIEIPANTTATLYLPTSHAESVTEDNQTLDKAPGVKLINTTEGGPVAAVVEPGTYNFVSEDFNSDLLYQPQGTQFSF